MLRSKICMSDRLKNMVLDAENMVNKKGGGSDKYSTVVNDMN